MKRQRIGLFILAFLVASVPAAMAQTGSSSSGAADQNPVTICRTPAVVPGQPDPGPGCGPGIQSGSTIQPAQASGGSIRIDPSTCPLPPAGGSVSCPGPNGITGNISATGREAPQPQAPDGGCLAANGSVCSGQGTAINGSDSSGCSTAVNDATASGGNCPQRQQQLIVPQPQPLPQSPQVPTAQPAPPAPPRQLALTG
jgi:hypothetical protein